MKSIHLVRYAIAVAVLSFACDVQLRTASASQEYSSVSTLDEAIGMVKEQLKRDEKEEFASLLSEKRVRHAILTAIRSYETLLKSRERERTPGETTYFNNVVKPVYLEIAAEGNWNHDCRFVNSYVFTDSRNNAYDGFKLRLFIDTPNKKFYHFALPVVSLTYGRFRGN